MSEKRYVQLSLTCGEAGDTQMVCWVEQDPRLKRGVRLTLKGIADVEWTVFHVYDKAIHVGSPSRTWRVGGLT